MYEIYFEIASNSKNQISYFGGFTVILFLGDGTDRKSFYSNSRAHLYPYCESGLEEKGDMERCKNLFYLGFYQCGLCCVCFF